MKLSFVGGDMRIVSLASGFHRDGHEVCSFALENAPPFDGLSCSLSLEACVAGADCIVLPLPLTNLHGGLNAPLSSRNISPMELLEALPRSAVICAGKPDGEITARALELGLDFVDYYAREELVALNALATAEGALSIMLQSSPRTIWESRVLIIGFGRIGKMLAERLRALGALVSISARKAGDRAYIRTISCSSLDIGETDIELEEFDFVINTVPAPILNRARLEQLSPNALCIDLASRPGGVDFEAAHELGLRAIWALGLPAETAPETSGEIIRETLMNILHEKRGNIC